MVQVPVAPLLADVQAALNPQQLPQPAIQQNGQLPTPNSAQLATEQAIQPAAQAVHLAAQNEVQATVLLAALACVQAAEQAVVQAAAQPELVDFFIFFSILFYEGSS